MTTARYATALTGGTAGSLDSKAVATLSNGDIAWVATGTVLYVYKFVSAATDAENSPSRIRPDDYATAGVWYLQNVSADYSQMVRNDIDGGDITTSSQTITVTPFSCWDSTREVWLETLVDKTWAVPATNNLEVYLFAVRATSGGDISVKGYDTYAGPASDGANVNAYRFLHWNENNGSGVLKPCRQVADRIDWTTTERPVLAASLTSTYAEKSISDVIPQSLVSSCRIIPASTPIEVSYDGVTNFNTIEYNGQGDVVEIISCPSIYLKSLIGTTIVNINSITLRR